MSRHRNVKNIDIDYEKDEYSDYSRSVEENFCVSPSLAQFIYRRDQNGANTSLADHFVINEETFTDDVENLSQQVERASRNPHSSRCTGFHLELPRIVRASHEVPTNWPTQVSDQHFTNPEVVHVSTDLISTRSVIHPADDLLSSEAVEEEEEKVEIVASHAKYPLSNACHSPVPKRKIKAWTVDKDAKPVLNLVVIGHVDAGKSTLMGHLLYQLGNVDQKTMHRFKQDSQKIGKSSFAFAWVLDESVEERSRGVTMDVAQTKFETPKFNVTLLDAPGHKDFIPNMITGASQADAALLVVNGAVGEFESGFDLGGQTREHALLVRSLGVQQVLVAVNKMDTTNWLQERFVEIQERLQQFLKRIGFANCLFVPCSGLMGVNLNQKPDSSSPLTKWYDGPSLLQALDMLDVPTRALDSPLRFVVGNVYKALRGSSFYASGQVITGGIQVGDKIVIMPSNMTGTVKAIRNSDDEETSLACAGEQCSLLLVGFDTNAMASGDIVCHLENPIHASTRFKCKIVVFASQMPLVKGMQVIVHCNSAQQPGYVSKLLSEINKTTGKEMNSKIRCLAPNSSGIAEIRCEKPLCLETAAISKELSRVTLRSRGATIAAGVVIDLVQDCKV